MVSPSPVPLPGALVVKSGSRHRSTASGEMPTPSSSTMNATRSPRSSMPSSTLPPGEQASQALRRRLTRTCSKSAGSHATIGSCGSGRLRTRATLAWANRCSTSSTAERASAAGSTWLRDAVPPRARVRNPRTMREIRSACSRMAETALRDREPGSIRGRSCSARPTMTPKGVDTSWATPVASAPRVASLSASTRRRSRAWTASATATVRCSSSSRRCSRSASPPKVPTRSEARAVPSRRRHMARDSRSRTRWAVATTTTDQAREAESTPRAMPASAVRRGSPSAAASSRVRLTQLCPAWRAFSTAGAPISRPCVSRKLTPPGGPTSATTVPGCSTDSWIARRASARHWLVRSVQPAPSTRATRTAEPLRATAVCSRAKSSRAACASRRSSQAATAITAATALTIARTRRVRFMGGCSPGRGGAQADP